MKNEFFDNKGNNVTKLVMIKMWTLLIIDILVILSLLIFAFYITTLY